MAACQFSIYISHLLGAPTIMQIAFQHFVWIDDLLNLSGPIALFMVSKTVRRHYLTFWTGGKFGSNIVLTSQKQLSHTSHPNRKEATKTIQNSNMKVWVS